MTKAATTRLTILQHAFELIYQKGYQGTSIDEIIATTKVTKGAFFYHFKTKEEMGLAIITEIMQPVLEAPFVQSLEHTADPIADIYKMMHDLLLNNPFLKLEYGCPVGNLAQEMTPWNKDFSAALSAITKKWHAVLAQAIDKGKEHGVIRKDADAAQAAYFIMAGYWGIRTIGKSFGNNECYHAYLKEFKSYLNSLK